MAERYFVRLGELVNGSIEETFIATGGRIIDRQNGQPPLKPKKRKEPPSDLWV